MKRNSWMTYPLGEVCDFQNGYAFRNQDYVEESDEECGLEIFRMGNICRGGGYNPDATKVFVPQKIAELLQRFLLNRSDILMCMTDMKASMALLGHTALLPVGGKYLLNQRVGRIRVSQPKLLDTRFLYYYSNSANYIAHLRSRANSGVQVNLSTKEILASPVLCPPLPIQRKIAAVLSAYDDLIENNTRRIAILEEMAQAIY
ncbi:MAG: restriction endonuclease subunit S, partial [Planctomycetia bacterium]|nr:restriction endonuclease subunit S [Planctomycetia bacterium]